MSGARRRTVLTGSPLSSTLARWTQPGFVKSVQRGTIAITGATSNTATITAVDTNNAVLRWLGRTYSAASTTDKAYIRIALTNGTTVTATVNTSPGANTATVSFEVVEFFPGVIKSVQRGTISGGITATGSINPVIVLKSQVDFLGSTTNAAGDDSEWVYLMLTNATTVTQTGINGNTHIGGYQVVEFY